MSPSSTAREDWSKPSRFERSSYVMKPPSFTYSPMDPSIHSRNMTKDWSAYVLNVNVAYKEDTDRVANVMRHVAEEMYADSKYRSAMLETIEIIGVDGFTASAVTIKARLKTRPQQQFAIG